MVTVQRTQKKKDRQCNIKYHSGALAQLLLQWKSSKCCILCVCVCSLRYPACDAYVSYSHMWSVRLYFIFPHSITALFKKKIIEYKMCVLIFSTIFVRNIYNSKK